MAGEIQHFIMRYSSPIGDYAVDESFDIYFEMNVVDNSPKNIIEARRQISKHFEDFRQSEVRRLQARISQINGMSHSIEDYRIKF